MKKLYRRFMSVAILSLLVVITLVLVTLNCVNYAKIYKDSYEIIDEIIINLDGEFVDLEIHKHSIPFARIRRITGYLVGTLDRFNNGKRAEEHDRVKHGIDDPKGVY